MYSTDVGINSTKLLFLIILYNLFYSAYNLIANVSVNNEKKESGVFLLIFPSNFLEPGYYGTATLVAMGFVLVKR